MYIRSSAMVIFAFAVLIAGCEKKPQQPSQPSGNATDADAAVKSASTSRSEHAAPPSPVAGHGGEVIELGESSVDGMKVKASRDKGDIKPGGDAPIDIWINGGLGGAAAVRFWIGTEDAKGSVKAKAEVEAGHWHTHTEVPDPLPAESKLWVEIEAKDGKKSVVSFGLLQ